MPKIFNAKIIDEIYKVRNNEAIETSQRLARYEGLFVGISSGAAVFTAVHLAKRDGNEGKTIVALLPDTGERYLSTALWQDVYYSGA